MTQQILENSSLERVISYEPKFGGKYKIPESTQITTAFSDDEIETVSMPIEELINIEEWLGNRQSEKRADDKARKDAMSGDFNLAHGIHFEVGELKNFDMWETMIDGKLVRTTHKPGSRFMLNGNTRAWAIRKGFFDTVPSHVNVNILKLDTLSDLQQLYWKIDSKLSLETTGDIFQALYRDLEFDPQSVAYKNSGSFGSGLSAFGGITCPKLWSKHGFSFINGIHPLKHEDVIRAQNRMRQEMFTCYLEEMKFNDMLYGKKTSDVRWDAISQVAHMIKFRGDGGRITKMHQKTIDAFFNPATRTPGMVNNPIQYLLLEAHQHSGCESDSKIEFPARANWGKDKVGGKGAVAKHLYYLEQIEKDGVVDKPQKMKRSSFMNGSFDFHDYINKYIKERKIFFDINDNRFIGANI